VGQGPSHSSAALPIAQGDQEPTLADLFLEGPRRADLDQPPPIQDRHPVAGPVRLLVSAGSPGLQEVEGSFAAYLSAEKELGRISPDADTDTLAVALIGTVHHLFMTHRVATADLRGGVRRVVEALIAGCTTGRAAALD
jgi:hypothetical protein